MENSLTLPGGIVNFRNLDTQASQMGPSFLSVKKERPDSAASTGIQIQLDCPSVRQWDVVINFAAEVRF